MHIMGETGRHRRTHSFWSVALDQVTYLQSINVYELLCKIFIQLFWCCWEHSWSSQTMFYEGEAHYWDDLIMQLGFNNTTWIRTCIPTTLSKEDTSISPSFYHLAFLHWYPQHKIIKRICWIFNKAVLNAFII